MGCLLTLSLRGASRPGTLSRPPSQTTQHAPAFLTGSSEVLFPELLLNLQAPSHDFLYSQMFKSELLAPAHPLHLVLPTVCKLSSRVPHRHLDSHDPVQVNVLASTYPPQMSPGSYPPPSLPPSPGSHCPYPGRPCQALCSHLEYSQGLVISSRSPGKSPESVDSRAPAPESLMWSGLKVGFRHCPPMDHAVRNHMAWLLLSLVHCPHD